MGSTIIIAVSIFGVLILVAIAYSISKPIGIKQTQSAKWGNRHVESSVYGGKPKNAVGFASEGNMAILQKISDKFIESLDSQLESLGISEEDWKIIQDKLRNSWNLFGNRNFKKSINELNEEFFSGRGCIAVYAE